MAIKHILSLEIPTVANCEILNIKDTSQYAPNLNVDCVELLVTSPGFNKSALIELKPNFDINLTACLLGTQTQSCGSLRTPLADGIYIIKYSVAPTNKVFVEYNHLRITALMILYYKTLCYIDVAACEPDSEKKYLIYEIKYIRTVIDAAVAQVEYCHNPKKGMALYEYAKKRLEKISCKTGSC